MFAGNRPGGFSHSPILSSLPYDCLPLLPFLLVIVISFPILDPSIFRFPAEFSNRRVQLPPVISPWHPWRIAKEVLPLGDALYPDIGIISTKRSVPFMRALL